MGKQEAAAAQADVDYILEVDAKEPQVRDRLLEIRRTLEHVRQTGHFCGDDDQSD